MKISANVTECKWKVLFNCCFVLLTILLAGQVPLTSCVHTKLMNENTTVLIPPINATQVPASNNTLKNDLFNLKKLPWWCAYSNELVEDEYETDCYCEGSRLERIPQILPNITILSIGNANLKVLTENGLRKYSHSLKDIHLTNLKEFYLIEQGAFKNFRQLRTIYIAHAPKFNFIAGEVFKNISRTFKTLRIIHSGLREIPDLSFIKDNVDIVSQLDFEGNQISEIPENYIRVRTEELIIDNNALVSVHRAAFNGSSIGLLSLRGNPSLRYLHERAFEGILEILKLDLSGTSIISLPSIGLEKLEFLRIQNVQSLTQIPSVYNFKSLTEAHLTHSFHCCAFKFPAQHDPLRHELFIKVIEEFKKDCKDKGYSQVGSITKTIGGEGKHNGKKLKRSNEVKNSSKSKVIRTFYDESDGTYDDFDEFGGYFHEPIDVDEKSHEVEAMCGNITLHVQNVKCFPKPDALNPCEDVMGSSWLRVSVWIVVSLAVFGNTAVIIVLFSHQSEFTVPKFLMLNLAVADLCMGLYLMLVAIQDLRSMGEYFNYAFVWQYGWGCRAAGWLTVFAAHLSIFTLTIITVERYFAITRAIYLNKRLKIRAASYIMVFGWMYSVMMATLPLFGISNYSSTSICLPMEANDVEDITYLLTVLALNGLGFFIVVICYAQIYFSLAVETRHFNVGEMTLAKKFSLLVFTNFACWAPIAFFGLTALAGYPLIDVTKSKILLVFFYPLNSCANPYLYAILTSQYRRDLFMLLSKFGICKQRAQQYRLNYSYPTHTIPLNNVASVRTSNSLSFNYRRSSGGGGGGGGHNTKLNTQEQQLLTTTIAANDNNVHNNGCKLINGIIDVDIVNKDDT